MTEAIDLSRRDFLRSRAAAAASAAVDSDQGADAPRPPRDRAEPAEVPLTCVARRAMACRFEVFLCPQDGDAVSAAMAALDEIDRLEGRLTVYRDDSDISRLNRRAAAAPVRLDAELYSLLARSVRLSEQTGGAFDVTTGALIKSWGFFKGPKRVPAEPELAEVMTRVGFRKLTLDGAGKTASFQVGGLEINLGSIGKGYALDRAAAGLIAGGARRFLMHAGHSSLIARGSAGDDRADDDRSDAAGWWVGLSDPRDPSRRLGRIRLRNSAMATSGSAFRHFVHEGKRYGHTLDPRTGRPAEGMLSVTVIAPTAAEADALSTALFVMGTEAAGPFCAAHPRIKALVVPEPAPGAEPEFRNFGIAPADLELNVQDEASLTHPSLTEASSDADFEPASVGTYEPEV